MTYQLSRWSHCAVAAAFACASLAATGMPAFSQDAQKLGDTERLGQRLFMTSCGLCHSDPDLVNKAPGPVLSKATLNGKAEDIAAFIKTGTNTMPSFSVNFSDTEIDAIAKFIITIPAKEAAK